MKNYRPFLLVELLGLIGLAAVCVSAEEIIHSLEPLGGSRLLPAATPEEIEKSKTFDPGAPAAFSLPYSAGHLVKSGVYKSLDCLVQGDRFEYWQDDFNGQFLAILPTNAPPSDVRIVLESLTDGGKGPILSQTTLKKSPSNKVTFLISMPSLKPGKYRVKASRLDEAGKSLDPQPEYSFVKADKRNPPVPVPADGIPIALEPQDLISDATWPVRTGVPFPVGALMDTSRLALFENGKQIPSQIKPVATWHPKGSVQWAHLNFLGKYAGGKPADYRLKLLPAPSASPKTALTCTQTDEKITVDTGAVRFEVNRKKFTGIETAWFDPTGSGQYDEKIPVIKGSTGPYLLDGRMIRFDASNDKNVQVEVEEQGPVRVTIVASGWYVNPEGRVDPFCMFKTRITAFAGQPMLRISHHTIITYDTRIGRLADAGFHIGSDLGEKFRLGADGATQEGALPATPKTVFLHQDRYDHFRVIGSGTNTVEGAKSDGWFLLHSNTAAPSPLSSPTAGRGDTNAPSKDGISSPPLGPELVAEGLGGEGRVRGVAVTVVLRDIWQKFPKEAEMGGDGITLHFWPKHGHRAFKLDDELDIKNIYKFWCFHQGVMLDLNLPMDYFEHFAGPYASETSECRPEHALNGNGQGLAIGNEFAVLFSLDEQAKELPKRAQLFQRDPTASASPEWNAGSGAFGRIAAVDRKGFPQMEEAVEQGYLSHNRCVERGQSYGMWNYANTHTYWDVENNRANLHRVWNNSHYHQMGTTWLMYYRSGSPDLLRWARKSTDNWMNVGTVNYAEFGADARPKIKFHFPGAMYHCKGLTQWGAEIYGMRRRDGHASIIGHFVDPDAFLWSWYLDGNERAREVYQMWADSYSKSPLCGGTRREANTTFTYMLSYYAASWNPDMLPAIRGMGLSLRTHEPLENQHPGPLWHPLYINRYYEHTRDPDYPPFILKYAREIYIENTWTTALAALAYEISGDSSYLKTHFEEIQDFPKRFYHAPGDPYDWYGIGPGPLGSRWGGYMGWGYFLHALQKARITDIKPQQFTRLSYLVGEKPRQLTVYALETEDKPFTLTLKATSIGGDLHPCEVKFYSPSKKELTSFKVPPKGGPSSWTEKRDLPADGETGLYRFELSVHEANVGAPVTSLPFEAMMLPKNQLLETGGVLGYLRPSDETKPLELTISSGGKDRQPGRACNVTIEDATGKILLRKSLFAPRGNKSAAFTFDPKQHKLPLKIDDYGLSTIQWNGEADHLFLGPSDKALQAIIAAQKNHP